jgi:Arc/MetJ family transcription regulator
VTKTLVNLDDDLLATAQRLLGTPTKKDTVNAALCEVVRRQAAVPEFVALAAAGIFEGTRPDRK